ncbi:hypothetical protein M501DRAFT_962424 [Patellaria atrata CBS 101060]|uniref:Uncharacterized protein n=1 Tax=Patellaria atrata CBS 101060 TaxID=1346257 RepID=A0A9P4S379_9PEZI|nr:hypothetical protein M501DRAFT_962424 [Patellaria atrata CBS 101060]
MMIVPSSRRSSIPPRTHESQISIILRTVVVQSAYVTLAVVLLLLATVSLRYFKVRLRPKPKPIVEKVPLLDREIQKIWIQPPKPLPGPDNHPFFARNCPPPPPPSIRRHSCPESTPTPSWIPPRRHVRRVPTNRGTSTIMYGETIGTQEGPAGWRRSTWNIGGV